MAFPPIVGKYQVIPGTILMDDGTTQTFSFNDLVALYNVPVGDCVLGPITGLNELRYFKLMPRPDGLYDDMNLQTELGDTIHYGPDFDGRKKYTQETDLAKLYAERENEQTL